MLLNDLVLEEILDDDLMVNKEEVVEIVVEAFVNVQEIEQGEFVEIDCWNLLEIIDDFYVEVKSLPKLRVRAVIVRMVAIDSLMVENGEMETLVWTECILAWGLVVTLVVLAHHFPRKAVFL